MTIDELISYYEDTLSVQDDTSRHETPNFEAMLVEPQPLGPGVSAELAEQADRYVVLVSNLSPNFTRHVLGCEGQVTHQTTITVK